VKALKKWLPDDSSTTHFMREVARLADARGWNQDELARRYNEATHSNINGGNIDQHFKTRGLRDDVMDGYAKVFGLSDDYVGLLKWRDGGEPYYTRDGRTHKRVNFRNSLDFFVDLHLEPDTVASLFGARMISRARRMLLADEPLAVKCVNTAELEWLRHKALNRSLSTDWEQTGVDDEPIVKWLALAELLRARRLDLLATRRQASLEVEGNLLRVFYEVCDKVDWDQWNALLAQFEAMWPNIDAMKARLQLDEVYRDWAFDNDPDALAANLEAAERNRELEVF
jgi:hypothetical protein